MVLHAIGRYRRDSARSYATVIRFAGRNSPGGAERWRFDRNRFACLAGGHREICRDGVDRATRAEELRFVSIAAARTPRTGPRDNRDPPLPRRPRVGRKRL